MAFDATSFDPQPPAGPSAGPKFDPSSFDQGQAPAAPPPKFDSSSFDQGPAPGQVTPPKLVQKLGLTGAPEVGIQPGSLVGKTMGLLNIGSRAEEAGGSLLVDAAVKLGIHGAQELKQKINRDNSWTPDYSVADVGNFVTSKIEKAMGVDQWGPAAKGLWDLQKAKNQAAFAALDIGRDPMWWLSAGATNAAKEAQKFGAVGALSDEALGNLKTHYEAAGQTLQEGLASITKAQNERNLIAVHNPVTGQEIASLSTDHPLVRPVLDGLAQNPLVKSVAAGLQKLSPNTGIAEVDQQMSNFHAKQMAVQGWAKSQISDVFAARKYSPEENSALIKTFEATPNHPGDIDPKLLAAADKGLFAANEAEVRAAAQKGVASATAKLNLPEGRAEQMVDDVVKGRKILSDQVAMLHNAGIVDETNINKKLLPNYMPRVLDQRWSGIKDVEELPSTDNTTEEYLKQIKKQDALLKKGGLDQASPIRQRIMKDRTFEEANEVVKGRFINDPFQAIAARHVETARYANKAEFLDTLSKFGRRLEPGEKMPAGYGTINADKFAQRTLLIPKEGEGAIGSITGARKSFLPQDIKDQYITSQLRDTIFPSQIADKVNYLVNPKNVTALQAGWQAFTQAFKNNVFLKPGIWIRNVGDNFIKTLVEGADIGHYNRAMADLMGESEGFRGAPTAANPKGKLWSAGAWQDHLAQIGLNQSGFARGEGSGVEGLIHAGKKLTLGDVMQTPGATGKIQMTSKFAQEKASSIPVASAMAKWIPKMGEAGENITRVALYRSYIEKGWEPQAALQRVNDVLFDWSRNSKAADQLRMIAPFIQHPLKTAAIFPEMLAANPGKYNAIFNEGPKLLANAFNDPVSHHEINQVLPEPMRAKDQIWGPMIPRNFIFSLIFGPNSKVFPYFSADFGPSILNKLIPTQDLIRSEYGLHPLLQSMIQATAGTDWKGKPIDIDPAHPEFASRAAYALNNSLDALTPYPEVAKIVRHAFGIGNPQYYDGAFMTALNGAMSGVAGLRDLAHDAVTTQMVMSLQRRDLEQSLHKALKSDTATMSQAPSAVRWAEAEYGQIFGTTPLTLQKKIIDSQAQSQMTGAAAQGLAGQLSPADYVGLIKGIDAQAKKTRDAATIGMNRMLQMMKER